MATAVESPESSGRKTAQALIDIDVHQGPPVPVPELADYIDEPWKGPVAAGTVASLALPYYRPNETGVRADSWPEEGGVPGSSYRKLCEQLLDAYPIETAILTGGFSLPTDSNVQPQMNNALAAAYNDWVVDKWLTRDERFRGQVCINANDPAAAAREIDRMAAHPQMVQVQWLMLPRSMGDPFFDPIFEAAERNDLVLASHPSRGTTTPIGFPKYWLDQTVLIIQHAQAQVVTMVTDGVFERFPKLRVSIVESGWTWLPSLMWHLDMRYRSFRNEVPWLRRLPSDYIRDHFRFSTQCAVEMSTSELVHHLDLIGSHDVLMYSSDYPHWDFDSPETSLPPLPPELRRKVFHDNAASWYRLTK
jgi:predicted TIM-barrel fold metal-dependent hydrolase